MRLFYLCLAACSPVLGAMQPASLADYRPSSETALVVFVRPSSFGTLSMHTVSDETGRLLGQASVKTSFAVRLGPGTHRFFIWSNSTASEAHGMTAHLVAGKRYYVELSASPFGQADLFAIAPRIAKWSQREHWIENSDHFIARGDVAVVLDRLAEADAHWVTLTDDERAERTLREDDGI